MFERRRTFLNRILRYFKFSEKIGENVPDENKYA